MANFSTQLSAAIELPEKAAAHLVALANLLHDWLGEDIDAAREQIATEDVDPAVAEDTLALLQSLDNQPLGTDFTIKDNTKVYIIGEEGPSVEAIAEILQTTMKRFSIDGAITLSWANTCSRPLPDTFGGGALMVTADDIEFFSTDQWLRDKVAALGAAPVRGPEAGEPDSPTP